MGVQDCGGVWPFRAHQVTKQVSPDVPGVVEGETGGTEGETTNLGCTSAEHRAQAQ